MTAGGIGGRSDWPPQAAAHGRVALEALEAPKKEKTVNKSSTVSSDPFSSFFPCPSEILENIVKTGKKLPITSRCCSIKISSSLCPLLFRQLSKISELSRKLHSNTGN